MAKAKYKFKKVEKFGEVVVLENKGDSFVGVPTKITTGNTTFGEAQFLQIVDDETGEAKSIILSAGLQHFDWDGLIGKVVMIENDGKQRNEKTKRTFTKFNVYEAE